MDDRTYYLRRAAEEQAAARDWDAAAARIERGTEHGCAATLRSLATSARRMALDFSLRASLKRCASCQGTGMSNLDAEGPAPMCPVPCPACHGVGVVRA